jgi:hypothetical protein
VAYEALQLDSSSFDDIVQLEENACREQDRGWW